MDRSASPERTTTEQHAAAAATAEVALRGAITIDDAIMREHTRRDDANRTATRTAVSALTHLHRRLEHAVRIATQMTLTIADRAAPAITCT